MNRRPRLLVPLTMNFSVRYLVRTDLLARLAREFDVVAAVAWHDDGLAGELRGLGIRSVALPATRIAPSLQRTLHLEDRWFRSTRLQTPTTAIDRRRQRALRPRARRRIAREVVDELVVRLPGAGDQLRRAAAARLPTESNIADFDALLDELRVEATDVLFSVTPFVRQEYLLLKAAERRGMRRATSILSFDNVTTRPPLPCLFDSYFVWNRYNRDELTRAYPAIAPESVKIVGPAQFDFYLDQRLRWDDERWRGELGLPKGRPVILYAGGPPEIAPDEPRFVRHLDEAIASGDIPGNPVILVRRHPVDSPSRWSHDIEHTANTYFDDPWPGDDPARPHVSNMHRGEIERLVATLANTACHVSVSSTMSLDGSFFDRPQVCPAYDDRPGSPYARLYRELYEREHFEPIVRSGAVVVATSRGELIAAVNDALDHPSRLAAERRAMLADMCTFADGRSAERVASALIEAFTE